MQKVEETKEYICGLPFPTRKKTSASMQLYNTVCMNISKEVTERYTTSFSYGIKTLHKRFRFPVYAIYGFVRYADEIVDTFHDHNQKQMLTDFKKETFAAIENGISTNPILHSFQTVVNQFKIDHDLIEAFFCSMEMDLYKSSHEEKSYCEYIYGSAEVVGLMCLTVFVEGDMILFEKLKEPACKLGSALQKVNFLRDMKSDMEERGRTYFPGVDFNYFSAQAKQKIEKEIEEEFDAAYKGIVQLPKDARLGVYVAYRYYKRLLFKIKKTPVTHIVAHRIRVPNNEKATLLFKSFCRFQLNLL